MTSDVSWFDHGICSGKTELFFPPPGIREKQKDRDIREAAAMTVCRRCPVIVECRNYARENDEFGIWGGENEEDRWRAGFLRSTLVLSRRKFSTRWKSIDLSEHSRVASQPVQQRSSRS